MTVLGIETSCDETAAAVLKDGAVLSSIVSSHWLHTKYGGVVPELASRAHLSLLPAILTQTLEDSKCSLDYIDAIAVTHGPGLIGALLVGISLGKAIAFAKKLPIIGVNHLEGHIWSTRIENEKLETPFLTLLVSGGHTMLIGVKKFGEYVLIGQTRDDAAGEAFDKVAVLCGLGYPGGVEVEKRARDGNVGYHEFPVGMRSQSGYDFSFSGLKTAVANFLKREPTALQLNRNDLLACFQEAAVSSLVEPTLRAFDDCGYKRLVIAGGVAANQRLKRRLKKEVEKRGGEFLYPGLHLCTDNASMVAWVGWQRLTAGERHGWDLSGTANLPIPGMINFEKRQKTK